MYSRPALVRMVNGTNGVVCNSSRIRGIMFACYRRPESTSRKSRTPQRGVPTRLLRLRLQQFDGVAELGGALVKFAGNGDFHFALHHFELGKRALGADFFQPFLEKRELGAFRRELREAR